MKSQDKYGNPLLGAVIDVETTGLEAGINEIIQISIIIHDDELNYVDKFVTEVRPMHPEWAEDKAMEINQKSLIQLKTAPTPTEVRSIFYQWHENICGGKKLYPLGQNFPFDKAFLQIFFGENYKDIFLVIHYLPLYY